MSRILMVIHRLWRGGGTETHLLSLTEQLIHEGHTVGVFTSGGAWTDQFHEKGARLHVYPRFRHHIHSTVSALSHVIRSNQYDILHAHDSSSYRLAAILPGTVPVVMTVHGLYQRHNALRDCGRRAKFVISVSPQVSRYIARTCGFPAPRIIMIPNGIATDVFIPNHNRQLRRRHGIPPTAFVIGYAGRFTVDKLQLGKRICKVMRQFTFDHSNIYVLVAGRNSKTAVESGRRMVVTGHISQMRHFYNACDVVVGTGRVALESLACGVPTIAVGSKRFMGLVTPSNLSKTLQYNFGDHASHNRPWSDTQLSHALLHVLENRESVQRQTSSLRTVLLGDFSVRHMAKMVIRVYQQAKGH